MNSLFRLTPRITSQQVRMYSSEAAVPKVSATKGGVIGFLLGVTAAGSAGYYYLLGEYNNASAALLLSVQELQASTDKVKDYAKRIETVDRDVAKLKETTATKQQLADMKVDFRKLYDTLNIEHLELKTHVWGLEKDLSNSSALPSDNKA
ncbi:hypothetical protein HMPREF1544_00145 [Mucor circinelloides 1006PhL]|uniref:Uncharacterized protein n=1 Tax=Mucor circinelloides f. circinelloides (strain 1006PhL) TaxID=1220926 RepID=S2JS75_MUCC1|nr:hypothetical protein HMPREF1544_00145 [Mucor circinelloides 1006PhL]